MFVRLRRLAFVYLRMGLSFLPKGVEYASWMKSYNPLLWMVARIVWYKIVHVGDFILSLLILYLFFLPPFFQTVFCAVRSIVFIRIHIRFCSMGHSWILVRIHTNLFIQLIYKLYSTNSYTVWFLYQFIQLLYKLYTHSYTVWFLYQFRQCLYELYSTNSYNLPAQAAMNKLFGDSNRIVSLFYTNSDLELV